MSTLGVRSTLPVVIALAMAPIARAQPAGLEPASVPDPAPTEEAAVAPAASAPSPSPAVKATYFVAPRSFGTKRDTEPPSYVRNASKIGVDALRNTTWLDVGLDQRLRFEQRSNDFVRDMPARDQPLLVRHRAFLAVKDIVDPLRVTLEIEDARFLNSQFEGRDADVNKLEPIQAFAELHFKGALGEARPISVKAGRMAMEYVDRRLIGRNEWRNTTNTFDGFRAHLGQEQNDWQLDLLAVQPVTRLVDDLDERDKNRWLFAVLGEIRFWAPFVSLQPYYMGLLQRGDESAARVERQIHTVGLRAYGVVRGTAVDYDAQGIIQFGHDGDEKHRAYATTSEVGYTFDDFYTTRVGVFAMYASGDDDPDDGRSGRFERLFGFVRPMSDNVYVQFENLAMVKGVVGSRLHKRVGVSGGYARYWLASATDRWNNANLRDMTGASGTHLGDELLVRVEVAAMRRLSVHLGYTYFHPGEFTREVSSRSEGSHFFYTMVSLSAFE